MFKQITSLFIILILVLGIIAGTLYVINHGAVTVPDNEIDTSASSSLSDIDDTASTTSLMATTTETTTAATTTATTSITNGTNQTKGTSSTYTLSVGKSINVSGITATLVSVTDSRCPTNVKCVQAGTVEASVELQKGPLSTTQNLTLGVPLSGLGYTGELTSVSPAMTSGKTIPQSKYSLTFTVSN